MLNPYGNIVVFFIAAFVLVYLSMALVKIIAPRNPNREKLMTYECGEVPIGSGWFNFNTRFYLISILFIVFDVEIVLIFPVIANFRDHLLAGRGVLVFIEIFLFIAILFLGLVYAWKNGYLEWLRMVRKQLRIEGPVTSVKEVLRQVQGRDADNA